MKITIFREKAMWTAHIGEQFEEPKVYPLVPEKESLLLLVKAIQNTNPDSKVFIATQISNNPFLAHHLFARKHFNMLPDYEGVQEMLNHPEPHVCNLCESEAWYNNRPGSIGSYQCTYFKCRALEYSSDPGHFYRLSRWAKNQGFNIYRTKEMMDAQKAKGRELAKKRELLLVEKLMKKYNLRRIDERVAETS